jgi:hypothetical protein
MGRVKKPDNKAILFKRLYGVKPETYEKMKDILQKEYEKTYKPGIGGRPVKLSVENKLMVTLKYLREYRTMEHIGSDYGVSKSTVCEAIHWVENTLEKVGTFALPGKKILKKASNTIQYIVIDVTESPVQRPKKTKKSTIQGKRSAIR